MRWLRWFKKEARGKELYILMANCLVLNLAYAFCFVGIMYLLKIDIPPVSREKIPIFTFTFPFMLIGLAFFEEILFRFPLSLIIEYDRSIAEVLTAALVLSVIFGVIHGSVHHIFIQGVGGFIYSILFLKSGGLQKDYPKAVAVTTVIHFMFNAILVVFAIAMGKTSI